MRVLGSVLAGSLAQPQGWNTSRKSLLGFVRKGRLSSKDHQNFPWKNWEMRSQTQSEPNGLRDSSFL